MHVCSRCGRRAWQVSPGVWACRLGHQSLDDRPVTTIKTRRRRTPWWLYVALPAAGAAIDTGVRLLGA